MAIAERLITPAEFDAWVLLPENITQTYELIGRRIVEGVSNNESSGIGHLLGSLVGAFVHQHKLGFTTGADGGYMIGNERYIPDAAFLSIKRQVERTRDAYYPLAPDLAIEVLSPSNTAEEIRVKIFNYTNEGTVVWVVDPDQQQVEVYATGQPVQILRKGAMLTGGDLLPGFSLAVSDIFS